MRNTHKLSISRRYGLVLLLFTYCFVLSAQDNGVLYPESSQVRSQLIDTWFTQDISLIREQSTEVFQNELGEYFLVRVEEKGGVMEIIVAPLVIQTLEIQNFNVAGEIERGQEMQSSELSIETWPKDGFGSWILYRDSTTGKNIKVRYYFMNDSNVFIDFMSGKDKSYANLSIYGALVAYNAPIPVLFDYFYTAQFDDIKKITKNSLPWKYVDINDNVYTDSMHMITIIRKLLPDLQKTQMFVSEDSEFEFLKWIINGLVKPLTGGTLFDDPLRMSTVDIDFTIPERQQTHKSYDYIRNLAAAALTAGTSLSYTYETSRADVHVEPFSVFTNESGKNERVNFVIDIGYQVDMLEALLYILTATEQDLFYLGAIREKRESSDGGRTPEQYYYNHAVAFFSWFDSSGKFHVTIFQNGAEYTLQQFLSRYSDSFVHLVRVKPSVNFFPEEPGLSEDENL